MLQDLERWNGFLCKSCNQDHLVRKLPPSCCATGHLYLYGPERRRVGIQTPTLDLSGGCKYWQAEAGGCSIYSDRFGRCRGFPYVGSLSQLVVGLADYPDCSLLDFLWRLIQGEIETSATTGMLNPRIDVPVFGPQDKEIVANLLYCYGAQALNQVAVLLREAEAASRQVNEPTLRLFFLDPQVEGVLFTNPLSFTNFALLEPVEGYPVIAALTSHSFK